jgi:hypothetical protein
MEKGLYQIANALEAVGVYIQTLNASGQTYGTVDRATQFPAPPGDATVVG